LTHEQRQKKEFGAEPFERSRPTNRGRRKNLEPNLLKEVDPRTEAEERICCSDSAMPRSQNGGSQEGWRKLTPCSSENM